MAATGLEAEMVVLGTVDNGLAPITANAPPSLGRNQLIRKAQMGHQTSGPARWACDWNSWNALRCSFVTGGALMDDRGGLGALAP
jgi:hypothetical protein